MFCVQTESCNRTSKAKVTHDMQALGEDVNWCQSSQYYAQIYSDFWHKSLGTVNKSFSRKMHNVLE